MNAFLLFVGMIYFAMHTFLGIINLAIATHDPDKSILFNKDIAWYKRLLHSFVMGGLFWFIVLPIGYILVSAMEYIGEKYITPIWKKYEEFIRK